VRGDDSRVRGKDQQFAWGKKSVDISERFLPEYLDYVAKAHEPMKVALGL
jgi:hypothetical protein